MKMRIWGHSLMVPVFSIFQPSLGDMNVDIKRYMSDGLVQTRKYITNGEL